MREWDLLDCGVSFGLQGSQINACAPASVKSVSQWPGGAGGSARPLPGLLLPRRRLTSQIETIAPPIGHRQRAAHNPSCALKHPFADI